MQNVEYLKIELEENRFKYEKACEIIKAQLEHLMIEENVKLGFPIEWRIKEWDSLYDKCERNNLNLSEISELNDIAGVRVICLLNSDVDKVKKIITQNFNVLKFENTYDRLGENQFGYGSMHFEITIKNSWLSSPTQQKLRGLKVELQLRTATQHIWAAVSHIFQYKKEQDVPPKLRRAINRAAAILETVDNEFERLFFARQELLAEKNVNEGKKLNIESLILTLDKNLPMKNKRKEEPYSILLEELFHFNIFTIEELEKIIQQHLYKMINSDRERATEVHNSSNYNSYPDETKEKIMQGVFYTHAGLLRGVMTKEFGKKFSLYQEKKSISNK